MAKALNYIDPAGISVVATPAIVDYITSIAVGQPVNLYQLQTVFQNAVASTMNVAQISLIQIEIAINGTIVPPDPETGLVQGDKYSFFSTDASHVVVQKYE